MRSSRALTLTTVTVAAAAVAAPALASPAARPTSLNLRASKATVAPHHKDRFTLTLRSNRARVTGATSQQFKIQERVDRAGAKWTTDSTDAVSAGTIAGTYVFTHTVTGPKGQKQQYRVTFLGGTVGAGKYAKSTSPVVTVTLS